MLWTACFNENQNYVICTTQPRLDGFEDEHGYQGTACTILWHVAERALHLACACPFQSLENSQNYFCIRSSELRDLYVLDELLITPRLLSSTEFTQLS